MPAQVNTPNTCWTSWSSRADSVGSSALQGRRPTNRSTRCRYTTSTAWTRSGTLLLATSSRRPPSPSCRRLTPTSGQARRSTRQDTYHQARLCPRTPGTTSRPYPNHGVLLPRQHFQEGTGTPHVSQGPGGVRAAHDSLHARRSPAQGMGPWVAFIDNTAGRAALRRGYGKDAFVNAMLSVFWATAARRGWRPVFARVESKANVADAVSWADLTRAIQERWQRIDDNADQIVDVLARRPPTPSLRPRTPSTSSNTSPKASLPAGTERGKCAGRAEGAPTPETDSFAGGPPDLARCAHPGNKKHSVASAHMQLG